MTLEEEWKMMFYYHYEFYEYRIILFDLCNAPSTFQHFVNDIFRDFLDNFLIFYLDDLFIYSNTLKEHKCHVHLILEWLQIAGLYLKSSKYEFHVQIVFFLGYIIISEEIHMDSIKIDSILSWLISIYILDIQIFIEFVNFYRHFIKSYNHIIISITNLLKKMIVFHWSIVINHAFKRLKKTFTTASILHHFDLSHSVILKTDISDYIDGDIISQYDDDNILHPWTFFNRKFIAMEFNYEIYDKEMLTIINCLIIWRHYFKGFSYQFKIYTNHKNLIWFIEIKIYNCR